jgi:hypothetical protein
MRFSHGSRSVNAAAREIGNVRSQAEPEPHKVTRGNFQRFIIQQMALTRITGMSATKV